MNTNMFYDISNGKSMLQLKSMGYKWSEINISYMTYLRRANKSKVI